MSTDTKPDTKPEASEEAVSPQEQRLMNLSDWAHFVAATTKSVAETNRIPINAAHAIVKTALEYEINVRALNRQQPSFPMPPIGAAEATEETQEEK